VLKVQKTQDALDAEKNNLSFRALLLGPRISLDLLNTKSAFL
jgi:hypothetical protein